VTLVIPGIGLLKLVVCRHTQYNRVSARSLPGATRSGETGFFVQTEGWKTFCKRRTE
jgi:hypothetical protein